MRSRKRVLREARAEIARRQEVIAIAVIAACCAAHLDPTEALEIAARLADKHGLVGDGPNTRRWLATDIDESIHAVLLAGKTR